MTTLNLFLLIAALLLILVVERFTRPRTAAWYMRRFKKQLDIQARIIGEQLAPAFEQATVAMEGLAEALKSVRIANRYRKDAE